MVAERTRTKKVLMLEDEALIARLVSRALDPARYVVDCAGTLREARARMDGGSYDLLIADLRLPDGDGASIMDDFRSRNAGAGVIVISGFLTADRDLAGIPVGKVEGCLLKPFALDDLRQAVANALQPK
jgi:DNA-binding response OmpR family regulator